MRKMWIFALVFLLIVPSAFAETPASDEPASKGLVEAGYQHSFAIKEDGTLWAWGAGEYGRLGVGVGGYALDATEVQLADVREAAAGYYHSLFLTGDGSVWVSGCNYDYGQVGDGSVANRLSPVKILEGARSVAASKDFSAVVMEDGSLMTWGRNDKGQLGIATTETARTPEKVALEGVASVSLGKAHGLALREDGTVWAWGDNEYGQLGDGTTESRCEPVALPIQNIVAVRAGNQHSLALDQDGAVWVWGDNGYNQLGVSGAREILEPQILFEGGAVEIEAGGDSSALKTEEGKFLVWGDLFGATPQPLEYPEAEAISLGYWHALATLKDGSIWGFGSNDNFQISYNAPYSENTFVSWIELEFTLGGGRQRSASDKEKKAALTIQRPQPSSVAAGYSTSFAIDANGDAWAWGRSDYGQLGLGVEEAVDHPQKLALDAPVRQIAAGDYHTLFLLEDGRLFAAGCNSDYGQLGNGTFEDSSEPVFVMEGVEAVFAGQDTSAALLADGTVLTWGKNDVGQLGRGEGDKLGEEPGKVELENVIALTGGDKHMSALTQEGELWVWGDNRYGQLGVGESAKEAFAPVRVPLEGQVVSVASGMLHMLALTEDGVAWAWGAGDYGQLGNNDTGNQPDPVKVVGLENAVQVLAGGDDSGAVLSSGRMMCWGYQFHARPSAATIRIYGSSYEEREIAGVASGFEHMLAIDSQGNLYAKGGNSYGELGSKDKVDSFYSWVDIGLNLENGEYVDPWEGENNRPENKRDNAQALSA